VEARSRPSCDSLRRWVGAVLAVTACGRIGFGSPADELADAGSADGSQADGWPAPDATPPAADGAPLDASPLPNAVFVTSAWYAPASLGGLAGADGICQDLAQAAGLPGTFVAWLSTSTVDARDRLAGARGWARRDGKPVADTLADLTAGRILHPPRVDERGAEVGTGAEYTVTATMAEGTLDGSGTCADFTAANGTVGYGMPYGGTAAWTAHALTTCGTPTRIYCFGIDRVAPLARVPAAGRRAFVTGAAFAPTGGVAAADALCAGEAATAGLAGSFRALVATGSASALSRFAIVPTRPWVRPDGIPLTPDYVTLASAPNVTATGDYIGGVNVWSGAADAGSTGSAATTCDDWMAGGAASSGTFGSAFVASPAFFGSTTGGCDATWRRLYCLEE